MTVINSSRKNISLTKLVILGRISRHEIISSPTPNNFPAEDNIDGQNNGNDKNLKYDVNPRKNKKSKTCNIL